MITVVFLFIAAGAALCFALRYFLLRRALLQLTEDLEDARRDLSQNLALHMAVPDKALAGLTASLNAALSDMQAERQKYLKREKEFQKQIENVSHDLRTPLTVILGYLKLMKNTEIFSGQSNAPLAEAVEIVERKAETMKTLVSQFYDYSRIAGGDYELTLERTDLARLLRESLAGNYQLLAQSALQIETKIPEHPVWVLGETSALERIFFNLLQNAGRYADTYLHISIEETARQISVVFINDTHLLTAEDVPHLFERFYMQDNARRQGGTGLGLTVAKSLAEKMNAALSAFADGDSRIGFRLTFVRLP